MAHKQRYMKVVVGERYIRRRDKKLAVVQELTAQNVKYILVTRSSREGILKNSDPYNVTVDGFRRGFRVASAEERRLVDEVPAARTTPEPG